MHWFDIGIVCLWQICLVCSDKTQFVSTNNHGDLSFDLVQSSVAGWSTISRALTSSTRACCKRVRSTNDRLNDPNNRKWNRITSALFIYT